jgi:predicted esterase
MEGPHQNQPLLSAGAAPEKARAAMLLVHGRGATAASILSLAEEFRRDEFLYLAPQAGGNTWYLYSFLSLIASNEPGISSGLAAIGTALAQVEAAGIPPERTILLGFSQGACLALEYAACNARRYGGVVGYSGGLIGPEGTPRDYPGAFEGTPVFLGCGVPDPHIPEARVLESAEVFRRLGGEVTARLYPRMGHTINADEIAFVREMMAALIRQV